MIENDHLANRPELLRFLACVNFRTTWGQLRRTECHNLSTVSPRAFNFLRPGFPPLMINPIDFAELLRRNAGAAPAGVLPSA